jgi:hypothetical protein|tara:strand:- start:640 stop:1272 length:633 start_codon:yes stop_codon:yes gene_type:complete
VVITALVIGLVVGIAIGYIFTSTKTQTIECEDGKSAILQNEVDSLTTELADKQQENREKELKIAQLNQEVGDLKFTLANLIKNSTREEKEIKGSIGSLCKEIKGKIEIVKHTAYQYMGKQYVQIKIRNIGDKSIVFRTEGQRGEGEYRLNLYFTIFSRDNDGRFLDESDKYYVGGTSSEGPIEPEGTYEWQIEISNSYNLASYNVQFQCN